MKAINKLIQVKDFLDQIALSPDIGAEYFNVAELLVDSINEIREYGDIGSLATKFEACLNMTHPDGVDPQNQYDRVLDFIQDLNEQEKQQIDVSGMQEWFQDDEVETKAVRIREPNGLVSIYKIPYDKQYTVMRGVL